MYVTIQGYSNFRILRKLFINDHIRIFLKCFWFIKKLTVVLCVSIMSDDPTRCTTILPVDSPRLSNRPTESELMELIGPLVEWQKFAIFLPKISSPMIKKIENDHPSTDLRKLALFSEWLKVDSYATWDKVIVALSKANEHYLASKVQENLITTIPPVDPYQGKCIIISRDIDMSILLCHRYKQSK